MAIALGDNLGVTGPLPTDNRYYNTSTNEPWSSVGEVNAALTGVRYTGLTVNISGVEYWYCGGVGDGNLCIKTAGGSGSLNMSGDTVGGLTTYVDATTICANTGLTFVGGDFNLNGSLNDDMEIRVRNTCPTGDNARGTVIIWVIMT